MPTRETPSTSKELLIPGQHHLFNQHRTRSYPPAQIGIISNPGNVPIHVAQITGDRNLADRVLNLTTCNPESSGAGGSDHLRVPRYS